MSQDPNLFSAFKRPRETLGPMDRNYVSGIPQPASAMKRSNSGSGMGSARPPSINFHRQSLLPSRGAGGGGGGGHSNSLQRASSGSNLADMMTGRHDKPGMMSSRKSYAPSSTGTQQQQLLNRRSSAYSHPRQSMATGLLSGGGSFFSGSGQSALAGAGVNKVNDPRPLRDRGYQQRLAQELMEYLVQNNFELEAKHSLSPNAMKSPTQKDFTNMFQWLYHRIDPHYQFMNKSIDNEAIIVLKNLKYPYVGNITKSQLGAAGGPHWPTYLAMLHWIMELGQAMDGFESGEYDDALEAEGVDMFTDRVGFRYLSRCYEAYMNSDDESFERLQAEMAGEFEARSSKNREHLDMLEAENERLRTELAEVEDDNGESPLDKQKKQKDTLEKDREKFLKYIEFVQGRIPKFTEDIQRLEEEITSDREEIKKLEAEKRQLQESIDRQGLSPSDIDRMNAEREKLNKSLESTSAKLEELQRASMDAEAEVLKQLELLELAVNRFNSLVYKIGLLGDDGKSYDVEIVPLSRVVDKAGNGDDERLLYDVGVGYTPNQILNQDLRHDVKPALNKHRSDIASRTHAAQDSCIKNQDYLETIIEAMADKNEEIQTLQANLKSALDEYSEIKETMSAETAVAQTEMEKLSAKMKSMRLAASQGILSADQKLQALAIEYDQIKYATHAMREYYHGEVEKLLNDVVKFKLHIQERLGAWDGDVAEEFERFLEERGASL